MFYELKSETWNKIGVVNQTFEQKEAANTKIAYPQSKLKPKASEKMMH